MNKKHTLLEKLKSIGLDDFKYCSLSYNSISLDWWYYGRDVEITLRIKQNNDKYYKLEVIFCDMYDVEVLENVVFEMNFLNDDLYNPVKVNKKLCKNLLPNVTFKKSRKKNTCLIESFDIGVKIFDSILYFVKDKEIQFKLDSKPTPEDPVYTEVKKVLRGELIVDSLKKKLIHWISNRFQIEVLHIIYDTIQDGEMYRINVIVKTRDEFESMHNSADINYNPAYQKEIMNAYEEIYEKENVMNTKLYKRLFVAYDSFHNLHGWSNENYMTTAEVKEIKEEFSDLKIWEILYYGGGIFVCLYKEEEVKKIDAARVEKLKKRIYAIEKKHDEFNLLTEEKFSINFISKETIDKDYNGNFINLFR